LPDLPYLPTSRSSPTSPASLTRPPPAMLAELGSKVAVSYGKDVDLPLRGW